MLIFMALAGSCAAAGMYAFGRRESKHRARMEGLDVNIHINGIRGKSTVTRMVGGMLRESGIRTISKTTGTYACVIDPEAGEHPIKRNGPANINEQYRFLAEWITPGVRGLVVECMAVKPKYQALCQDVILRSDITVITNVRLDHQEDMGDTRPEIAASLCNTVPREGIVITGERDPEIVDVIAERCQAKGSRLIVAQPSELSARLAKEFSYRQFEENVAVALAIAEVLDLDVDAAVRGMLAAEPDPGTTKITRVTERVDAPAGGESHERSLYWVPMFAVNDWESTTSAYRSVVAEDLPEDCRKVIALNNRAGRTDRATMFVDVVTQDLAEEFDRVVLYGEIQEAVRQRLLHNGLDESKIVSTADLTVEDDTRGRDLIERAVQGFDHDAAIFGMVNIHTPHVKAMQGHVDTLVEGSLRSARASELPTGGHGAGEETTDWAQVPAAEGAA